MHPKVIALQKRPQIQQRTTPWYEARRNLITASEAGSVLCRNLTVCKEYIETYKDCNDFKCELDKTTCNPYASEREFLLSKYGKRKFSGSVATDWGTAFEPIATNIYEIEKNTKIHEFGLIVHEVHKFLAASPDGCTDEGVLVEIKAPYRRIIGEYPVLQYWIQCQLQMEVCNIDTCDFFECEFIKMQKEDCEKEELKDGQYKGVYVVLEDGTIMYPGFKGPADLESQMQWADKIQGNNTLVFWKLCSYQIITIKRERQWFERVLPLLHRGFRRMKSFDASRISDDTIFEPINPLDLSPLIPRRLQLWEITEDLYSDDE